MRHKQFDSIIANYNLHKNISDTEATEQTGMTGKQCLRCLRTRYDAEIVNCVVDAAVAAARNESKK